MTAILRTAHSSDAEGIWALLERSSTDLIGMTSLPKSIDAAEKMSAATMATVADLAAGAFELDDGRQRHLVFVAVDHSNDSLLGVTGVTFKKAVPNLVVRVATSEDGMGLTMRSSSTPWTGSELNASFLGAHARGKGVGTLLSRGRFMLLHLVQSQIPKRVGSHLRGRFVDGSAPFWQCFGAHFAPQWKTSNDAELALNEDPSRLVDLAGLDLGVTADVLDSLGLVNSASLPAFHLLMSEGLQPNGMYDPIDGGPMVAAELTATITNRYREHGEARLGPTGEIDALVSVTPVSKFRVVRAKISIDEPHRITLDEEAMRALGIESGALVSASPLNEPK